MVKTYRVQLLRVFVTTKNWAKFARGPLKIFDAELQCGDSEQALIHFSVSPSSVKHQSHFGGCGNYFAYMAAPRKLCKRGRGYQAAPA